MKKIYFLILIPTIFFSHVLFAWPPDNTIVNGQETNYKEWIGVVGIIYDVGGGYYGMCTASLIAPDILLTAAHCVYSKDENGNVEINAVSNPSRLTVHNGSNISLFTNVIAKATRVIIHERWSGELKTGYFDDINDIALVKLDRRITDLEIYRLRERPLEREGDDGVVVGYGRTERDKNDHGVHRKGTMYIYDMNEFRSKSFTARSKPSNTCTGDSGGPFFTSQGVSVISGVTSYGTAYDCSNKDSEFVHVLSYIDWIDEKMKSLSGHGIDKVCGNGRLEDGEVCELGFKRKCSLINPNFSPDNYATCNDYCSGWNESECHICGDGFVSGNEVCDGGQIPCSEVDSLYPYGWAYCNSTCSGWNKSECMDEYGNKYGYSSGSSGVCGNGVLEVGEECDDGALNGSAWSNCTNDCKLKRSSGGCNMLFF